MILYGAQFCPKCRAVEKNLKELNFTFEKIDATTLSQEELEKRHIVQIPMISYKEVTFYAGDMTKTQLSKILRG